MTSVEKVAGVSDADPVIPADASREKLFQGYQGWQPMKAGGGDTLDGLRQDPKSGIVVLWDEKTGHPLAGKDGQTPWVKADFADSNRADVMSAGKLAGALQDLQELGETARRGEDFNRDQASRLLEQIRETVPHLTAATKAIKSAQWHLDAPHFDAGAYVNEITKLFDLALDPTLYPKMREIDAYYERNADGDPNKLYAKISDLGSDLDDAMSDIVRTTRDLALLESGAPLNDRDQHDREGARLRTEQELDAAVAAYVAAMVDIQTIGPHPYPELDSFLQDRANQEDGVKTGLRVAAGAVITLLTGVGLGFAPAVAVGALTSSVPVVVEQTQSGLRELFRQAKIDPTDAQAVKAFAQSNQEAFKLVYDYALWQGVVAAGSSAAGDLLAKRLFGDIPLIEDGAAIGIEELLRGYLETQNPNEPEKRR